MFPLRSPCLLVTKANGENNSGKTSIISLLERFYDVSQGQILFDDKDIYSANVGEYRKLISLVAQEPGLFQGELKLRWRWNS
jgi:ATP-binding cassette, subfamily B (MDR/TAP), member 1